VRLFVRSLLFGRCGGSIDLHHDTPRQVKDRGEKRRCEFYRKVEVAVAAYPFWPLEIYLWCVGDSPEHSKQAGRQAGTFGSVFGAHGLRPLHVAV
jgi:hypothetical protein